MAKTGLFEAWTFSRPLPHPFSDEAAKRGSKHSTEASCLSVHNLATRGRKATLHGPTLHGLMLLAEMMDGDAKGALGIQKESNKMKWYCMETVKETGGIEERRVFVYEPLSGRVNAGVQNGSMYSHFPRLGEQGATGKEIIMLAAYASTVKEGALYNTEFDSAFAVFRSQKKANFPDLDRTMQAAFLCCDNLYRRLENRAVLRDNGIPFHQDGISSGNIPLLVKARLNNGYYAPSKVEFGEFKLLKIQAAVSRVETLGDLKGKYDRHFPLTEKEQRMVPALPDFYQVPEEVLEIVNAVTNTPMRVFMSAGESGTGKTTNAKMVAQLLGLPYYFFTCGEGTDEVELVSSMIPNTGKRTAVSTSAMPTFQDMMMDPATALEQVCGIYEEGISQEEAFQRILSRLYQDGYQKGQSEKDYVMVESSIVTACRRPSVIEIQEPSVITKPGTLVKLNGLLDDGAAITLTDGEVVRRNPETIVLLTTNMGYRGCKAFNESVLSRMRMILYSEPLKAQDMVKRIRKKVPMVDQSTLKMMAETVCSLQKYLKTEMISGGVCGYREYEDWVWAYVVQQDICKAALRTIVAKAAPEEEDRNEIYKTQILTKFAEGMAA